MIDVWEERGDDEGVVDDSNDASEAMEEEEEAIEVTVQESRLVSKQVQYGGWRTGGRASGGGRGVAISVRPCGHSLSKALNLQLSCSGLS